jgi:phosphohistidine phosphatase
MKRLTLVRHGNADWKDSSVADFDRTLNRRGTGESEAIARRLLEQDLMPDLLLASAACRTTQTAEALAREFGMSTRRVHRDEQLYLARAEDLIRVIQTTGGRVGHLMLVGHNPGLSELMRLLTADVTLPDLGTACACTMTFDVQSWTAIEAGGARSFALESPPSRLFGLWGV